MATDEHKVASLFSGCGGFDLGFSSEGFRTIAAYDINPHVVDVFNKNVAPVAKVCDLSVETPEIGADVLIAGSPCQGFSTVGKRDFDDPRNDLLVRAGEIALRSKPRVFVLENVPAAISGRHGSRWQNVESMLKAGGYNVARVTVDGVTSGVPQIRKRLFLLAWKGASDLRCEFDSDPACDISEALANVEGLSGHDPIILPQGSKEQRIAARIGPGQKLCNVRVSDAAVATWQIPEVFGAVSEVEAQVLRTIVRLRRRDRRRDFGDADPVLPSIVSASLKRRSERDIQRLIDAGYLRRIGKYIDLRHTYNGKFRRLPLQGASPTVDTHFGNPGLFLHPSEDRGLTPREAARIQGLGDDFAIACSRSQAFRMIGNAVPPPMAAKLARFVRSALLSVQH